MVKLSSARRLDDLIFRMGSKEVTEAETKLLHLFAKHILSTPHRQLFLPNGRIVLCIPLVHGSYPAAMNCCAFSQVYACWWFILRNEHLMDMWPFSMSNPHKKYSFQLLYHLYKLEKSALRFCCCTPGGGWDLCNAAAMRDELAMHSRHGSRGPHVVREWITTLFAPSLSTAWTALQSPMPYVEITHQKVLLHGDGHLLDVWHLERVEWYILVSMLSRGLCK